MEFNEFFQIFTKDRDHPDGLMPYRWQRQVCESMMKGGWDYNLLWLTTAAGKTMLMAIWYYVLCRQLSEGLELTVPIRYWHVINRRFVVDDVTLLAEQLKKFAKKYFPRIGLGVFRLRGGLDEKQQSMPQSPTTPGIYVSTLDALGSSVLLRSYIRSGSKLRSMHAGLAAFDSLIVLDESHLSVPFIKLIESINRYQKQIVTELPFKPMRLVKMSATVSQQEGDKPFPITQKILSQDLGKRLSAVKTIRLVGLEKKVDIPKSILKFTEQAIKAGNRYVLVVCNTIAVARQVTKVLEGSNCGKHKIYLLIGQQRPYEYQRSRNLKGLLKHLKDRKRRKDDEIVIVVSTQTIEVGVDYDFDHMISELASLPSLIQRAGRLNRGGHNPTAEFVVIYKKGQEIPIYGDSATACLDFLENLPELKRRFPLQNEQLLQQESLRCLRLTMSEISRLTVTTPHIEVNINPYIHGIKEYDREVMVVWRENLTEKILKSDLEVIEGQGIKPAEVVRISLNSLLYTVRPVGDLPSEDSSGRGTKKSRLFGKACIIRRHQKYFKGDIGNKIHPDDLIILPTSYGGLDKWGWNIESENKVNDVFNEIKSGKVLLRAKSAEEDPKINDYVEELKKLHRKPEIMSDSIKIYGGMAIIRPKNAYERADDKKVPSGARTLENHTRLVGYFVNKFITDLGFDILKDEFIKAASFHDLGKADWRFQQYMYGNRIPNPDKLMGKPIDSVGENIQPRGWRHELLSLQILIDSEKSTTPLIRHLVGSHHGHWRPYGRMLVDDLHSPRKFYLSGIEWESAKPFSGFINGDWETLTKKWGAWGLAFLETIFRLADHSASAYDKKNPPWKGGW